MTGLQPPPIPEQLVPIFSDRELTALEKACAGRSFAQRRDTAIIALFTATGIRLAELAGIRYLPDDPGESDVDLWQREITVHGKGRKDRIVKFGHHAAVSLDRYLLAAHLQLWLGAGNREPLSADGIYQMIARRGEQAGVAIHPHRFPHHFAHTWIDRGGPEEDLMELCGMTRDQLAHVLRAVAGISGEHDILVIGSQSIPGS